MAVIVQVPPSQVVATWPMIEGYLGRALEHAAGEYTLDQLKVFLVEGKHALLISVEEDVITGAAAVVPVNYPNASVAFISAIGGRLIANRILFGQLCNWCRNQGFTCIRGACFESVARLWKQRFGMGEIYRIVEMKL